MHSKSTSFSVRIGTGAGMADDRIEPAVQLLQTGQLNYMVCECLAERTIAREALNRINAPEKGYTPMLEQRIRALSPLLREKGVRLVTNMGAANPVGAAHVIQREARQVGVQDLSCAAVIGDDVLEKLQKHPELQLLDGSQQLESLLPRLASANAYLGADVVKQALATGADVVVTGRVADPSLFLGVAMYHHDWSYDDFPRLAAGTIAGHLLECSTQLTGGYFADPGKKEVPRLAHLSYPYADISFNGDVTVGKVEGTGGRIDRMTCTEQALYEIHNPSHYITPDCVMDLMHLNFEEESIDRVRVLNARAKERTSSYKVVVGYFDGYIGVGEVSYAGINALARAQLGAQVVQERFAMEGGVTSELQIDFIGISSLHGNPNDGTRVNPYEVRLRIAARCPDKKSANLLGEHVRQLNMQGPAAAGGPVNFGAKEIIAVNSVLIPREWVKTEVVYFGALA